jgi:bacillithiol biosynthesis cysteine-adding enzyme BshC
MLKPLQYLSFKEAGIGSALFHRYVADDFPNTDWIEGHPNSINVELKAQHRSAQFPAERRKILVNSLRQQYEASGIKDEAVEHNLLRLQDSNTLTVTTGHQLGFAGGPLFLLYKIASVIKLAESLEQKHPQLQVVPIFWMNSDDHDLAEINTFFWQDTAWTLPISNENHPVGQYLCPEMPDFWASLHSVLPSGMAWEEAFLQLKTAYAPGVPLGLALRRLIAQWTKGTGLICLDQQDSTLKSEAWTGLLPHLNSTRWFDALIETTNKQESVGFSPQVKPMPSLFFYHSSLGRERIERLGSSFQSVQSNTSWNFEELAHEMQNHPDRFSTNVSGRAMYQEFILPNLAYLGGAAEIRYWMQFKQMLSSVELPFPMLVPRESFLVFSQRELRYLRGFNAQPIDALKPKQSFIQHWVRTTLDEFPEMPWTAELNSIAVHWAEVFGATDPGLKPAVLARFSKLSTDLEKLNTKRLKALKQREQTQLQRIDTVFNWTQPKGIFQERILHPWCLGPDVRASFNAILSISNPLSQQVVAVQM